MTTSATAHITSRHHSAIAALRKLHRRRERDRSARFVAEGEDLLAAADAAGRPALERFCAAGSGLPGTSVAPEVLDWASTLGSGTRAVGVYEQRWSAATGPLCVYLHEVGDPGNVGAVLRSALAFGASEVALGSRCADPFGPKAVRASMGAIFVIPIVRAPHDALDPSDPGAALDALPGRKIALVPGAGRPLAGPAQGPVTIVLGAERSGLPKELIDACDEIRHIPTSAHSESLNVAMAATIALYELTARPNLTAADRRMAQP